MKKNKAVLLNLANKLTLSRILLVPIIVVLLLFPGKWTCLFATLLFILASATDWIDGYVARRSGTVTSFGKFLDPLADKVLISSILIMLTQHGWVPGWIVAVIVARELMVTGMRAMAMEQGVVIAADKYGKLKTIVQIFALIPLTLHYRWFGLNPLPLGSVLLYIALVLTVFSGANYLYAFRNCWNDRQNKEKE